MQIILLKDVAKLGKEGEAKNVADGYALNFLLPQKLAMKANAVKLKEAEERKTREEKKVKTNRTKDEDLIKKLQAVKLKIKAKASEGGKLFAGIAAGDIVRELKEQKKIELEDKFVKLDKKIKELGEHQVEINFGSGLGTKLAISIVGK